jgi:sugar phosphate isomerase/epimerase
MTNWSRRRFLETSAGALAALGAACSERKRPGVEAPWFKISLAEWSLHRTLAKGELDHLDFVKTAKRDYGLDGVEYVNTFFFDRAEDRDYLGEMKTRAEGEAVRSLLIMCDAEGRLGDPDESARTTAVENHYKWVEAAKFLGCHAIRVNAASEGDWEEQMKLAADGLRRLAEFGDGHDIDVIVENHGELSSNGSWLAGVIEMVGHPRAGTLPDFGNFRVSETERYDNYQGVTELMPYAKAVSAKSYDFDENGNESELDYRRLLKIVKDAGYRGYVGIEYEGDRLSEPDGIRATKALLERVREELSDTI